MSLVELEPVFISQLACTCPKTAIKTPEQCVKYVTSSSVFIVDFDIFHTLLLPGKRRTIRVKPNFLDHNLR